VRVGVLVKLRLRLAGRGAGAPWRALGSNATPGSILGSVHQLSRGVLVQSRPYTNEPRCARRRKGRDDYRNLTATAA
jgi:hypothetical protein